MSFKDLARERYGMGTLAVSTLAECPRVRAFVFLNGGIEIHLLIMDNDF